ncbi:MAG: arylsulfatase [Fuerstiella sp.]
MNRLFTAGILIAVSVFCAAISHGTDAAQPQSDGTHAASPARTSPNIVFILADDMGYGDLGCYGAEKIKTPNIDRLATEGILFTDGHCGASTCTPTRYGLMTGRHAWRSWCKYSALSTNAPLLIEEDRVTIASFLKSAGYSTSIVGKWHLGYGHEEGFEDNRGDLAPNFWDTRGSGPNWNGELKPGPRENGFDYSYVVPVANSFPPYVFVANYRVAGLRKNSPIGNLESRNHGKMEGGEGARWTDEELIDKFAGKLVSQLESLAEGGGNNDGSGTRQEFRPQANPNPKALAASATNGQRKPFFLLYTPTQPHIGSRVVKRNSHWPNELFRGTSEAGNYGDVVQELDWSVGEILKTLDHLGLTENTLVIFASDNGGYTRNFNGHQPNGHILRGGKGDLVEGGHRVPFLAKWQGKIKPGTRSKETISTTDMLATFAKIIGKDLPAGAGPDSYNVLPALLGQNLPHPQRPVVLSSGGTGAISIRTGKWKLMDGQGNCGYGEFRRKEPWPTPKPGDPPAQLYNLEEDLGEANNLYLKHPEIVHRLKVGLERIKADENYNPTALEQPKDALTIEQLNALFAEPQANLRSGTRREFRHPANPKVLATSATATLTQIGGKIATESNRP